MFIDILLFSMLVNTMQMPSVIPSMDEPVIDGYMETGEWDNAYVYDDKYYEISPILGNEPDDSMHVYMGHDEQSLYLLFKVFQDTSNIISKSSSRDNMGMQDMVGLLIDPMGNRQEEYLLLMGLPDVITDFRKYYTDGYLAEDITWDSRCQFKTRIADYGYNVELALPFDNFRRQDMDTLLMNINFYRQIRYKDMELSYYDIEDISSKGEIDALHPIILTGVRQQRERINIMPYGTYGTDTDNNTFADAGFDMRIPISNASMANVAFNPDFSQLEGDPLEFDFNAEYALYYDEYRPFFTEERGVFNSDNELYYSRAIVNPYVAGKYTLKDPNNQAGIIIAFDQADSNIGNSNAIASIIKYKRKMGDQYLGTMLTGHFDRDSGINNGVASADMMLNLPLGIIYDINAAYSIMDSSGSRSDGFYHDSYLRYITNTWLVVLHANSVSPYFENNMGYVTDTDQQYLGGYIGHIWRPNNDYVQKIELGEDFGASSGWDNTIDYIASTPDSIEYFFNSYLKLNLFKRSYAQAGFNYKKKFFDGVFLTYYNILLYNESRINKQLSYDLTGLFGYNIDYNYARLGKYKYIVGNIHYTPIPQLTLNAGGFVDRHDSDPNSQALTIDALSNTETMWNSYSVDMGITYSPISVLSLKFIAQRTEARFADNYHDVSEFIHHYNNDLSVTDVRNRLFCIVEYEPFVNNMIYLGSRYELHEETQINDEEKRIIFFFKFASEFNI